MHILSMKVAMSYTIRCMNLYKNNNKKKNKNQKENLKKFQIMSMIKFKINLIFLILYKYFTLLRLFHFQ